jgi:hypothetical protein
MMPVGMAKESASLIPKAVPIFLAVSCTLDVLSAVFETI